MKGLWKERGNVDIFLNLAAVKEINHTHPYTCRCCMPPFASQVQSYNTKVLPQSCQGFCNSSLHPLLLHRGTVLGSYGCVGVGTAHPIFDKTSH